MNVTGKPTDKMLEELLAASDIDSYFKANAEHFIDYTVAEYLCFLVEHDGLKKSDVFRDAEMNEIYGYQIFAGKRVPSRDKLLCLGIAMKLTIDGIQKLMKIARYSPLYAKSIRDSVIIKGISTGSSVDEINAELYRVGEETL